MANENQQNRGFWRIPKDGIDLEKLLQVAGFTVGKKEVKRLQPPANWADRNDYKKIYYKRPEKVVGEIQYSSPDQKKEPSYSVQYPPENMDLLNHALRLRELFSVNSIPYTEVNKDPIAEKVRRLSRALDLDPRLELTEADVAGGKK